MKFVLSRAKAKLDMKWEGVVTDVRWGGDRFMYALAGACADKSRKMRSRQCILALKHIC